MSQAQPDPAFSGSIPELYDRHLVPMLFESYAHDLTRRLRDHRPSSVLEIAAGTGVVTRSLADATDSTTAITATDLSQQMIDHARVVGTSRPVEWAQADALSLPFEDRSFDEVISQFGVMFVADEARGFAEMRRVLRLCAGGALRTLNLRHRCAPSSSPCLLLLRRYPSQRRCESGESRLHGSSELQQ